MTLLWSHLDKEIAPVIAQQIMTLEISFTLKMEMLLMPQTLSMTNIQTAYMVLLYDLL